MKKPSITLSLLSFVLLCFVALHNSSSQVQAAAIPSNPNRDARLEAREFFMATRLEKRKQQEVFNVDDECSGEDETSTSSTSKASTTAKATSTSAMKTSTTAKVTSTSTSFSKATSSSSTKKATSTSTSSIAAVKTTSTSTAATATSTAGSIVLTSNNVTYGAVALMKDLNTIVKWAEDEEFIDSDQKDEVVAALLSASARYYPEIPTEVICRIMLADIRQESDYNASMISGGRLDSGSSWGLLQVSPGGGSQELLLFQEHANVETHNFTFGMPDDFRANVRGPLLDYATGQTIDLASLTNDDLFRPWINIHVAMWIQSNLARSSSQDPYNWQEINAYSWQVKTQLKTSTSISTAVQKKWNNLLVGASLPTSIRTALGSWVAGPATDGDGSYLTSGDDISNSYLNEIMKGVRALYGISTVSAMPKAWLDNWVLYPGLVDYV